MTCSGTPGADCTACWIDAGDPDRVRYVCTPPVTKAPEFKVGDRVRVKEGGLSSVKAAAGLEATVVNIFNGFYEVEFESAVRSDSDCFGRSWFAYPQEIVKVWPMQACGEPKVSDAVHRPTHYTRFKIEPVYFLMVNEIGFAPGNVIKYVLRHDAKNGVEDLKKARRYLDMMIAKAEGNEKFAE